MKHSKNNFLVIVNRNSTYYLFEYLILLVLFLMNSSLSFSQNKEITKVYFSGSAAITNNGISLVPTFSLDKPAAIFNFAIGKRKLSFEPELRFSLDGKPWSFLFWGRYKLVDNSKFFVRVGLHPALSFLTKTATISGETEEILITQRFVAGEFTPNYMISKNISIGMYYFYGYGIDNKDVRNTNLLMFHVNFTNIKLSQLYALSYLPQVYFLKINQNSGVNITSTITLSKKDAPFSFNVFLNKTIQSKIIGSKDFIWNMSLIYKFSKKYITH